MREPGAHRAAAPRRHHRGGAVPGARLPGHAGQREPGLRPRHGRPFLEAASVVRGGRLRAGWGWCRRRSTPRASPSTRFTRLSPRRSAPRMRGRRRTRSPAASRAGVLVGMSGGVDSAVAALLLKEQGHRVVGITLTFWNDPRRGGRAQLLLPGERAPGPEGGPQPRASRTSPWMPRQAFYDEVVEYFVSEYAAGRTPNPCAKCNSRVRLGLLVDVAHRLGLARRGHGPLRPADGHSAAAGARRRRARRTSRTCWPRWRRRSSSTSCSPWGRCASPRCAALAARGGLEGHSAPESQEICFVPDDDHRRFLRERLGDLPGDIVDTGGPGPRPA